jgi:mannose-6-phosphate isomerase-like protein (cupin superfamily)
MLDAIGTAAARLVAAEGGEALGVFGASMVVKADPAIVGVFLAGHRVPPGYAVPPHRHEAEDEIFFLLEGALTLLLPEGERRIGPGETAVLPRGTPHGFRNDGASAARALVLVTPGLQAVEMFRHLDRATRAAGEAGLPPWEIVAIAAQYGVHFAPPPQG